MVESRRLSPKAREILDFIARVREAQGAPPTLREIGARFGIRSTNGVRYYVDLLEHAGAIARRPRRARGIALRRGARPSERRSVPILGRIAAGGPVFSAESAEGAFDLGRPGRTAPDFALRVAGDSMRDAGILHGDLVLVRRDPAPREGEIVVALIGEETTVKRFFREKRSVVLRAENPSYPPITVTASSPELRILGKVVGVFREIG
jgi:repressor LexA